MGVTAVLIGSLLYLITPICGLVLVATMRERRRLTRERQLFSQVVAITNRLSRSRRR